MTNDTDTRTPAIMQELREQRSFLGDRAANLAAELSGAKHELALATARIRSLEKELQQCRRNPELPLGT